MKKLILMMVVISGFSCLAQVTITTTYDNKRGPMVWRNDDLVSAASRAPLFLAAANLARSNNIVFSPACYGFDVFSRGTWRSIQDQIDDGMYVPGNHSYSHPVNFTNWYLQFVESRNALLAGLQYPWQYRYKGKEYLNVFCQWGGITNMGENTTASYASTNGYLMVSGTSPNSRGWPTWDTNLNSYGYFNYSDPMSGILSRGTATNSTNATNINNTINSNLMYVISGHAWTPEEDVSGTNSAFWTTYFSTLFGNRKNVWYADLNGAITYHYHQAQSPPSISIVSNIGSVTFTVTGVASNRVKYGLTYPLTYKVTKPVGWPTNTYVYYKDATLTNWTTVIEKTTNDYFTGINCFRNDATGAVVYVSHGLPQAVDVMQIMVTTNYVAYPVETIGIYTVNIPGGY